MTNAMTVDVEDYFHVSAFESAVERRTWDSLACRVEANTDLLLEQFDSASVNATFFTLGWVAERYPGLIRRIADGGHEIASHSCNHVRITEFSETELYQDAVKSKKLLEDISGCEVSGYRAPSFSIVRQNLWALTTIREAGYLYSSSIYPVQHDLYGIPDAPRFPFIDAASGLLEIPVSTLRLRSHNMPVGGGGFFRLYPYGLSRWALARVNQKEHQPCVFYTHPWEYDPDQPRNATLDWKSRTRHYLNLANTKARLCRLLTDFEWDRMDRVFLADAVPAASNKAYAAHVWN